MDDKKWGCLKTTAVGCGIALVAAIALPVILGVMIVAPLNQAVDDREVIEEKFGTQEDYVPPASGAPTADRVELFLEIQRSLVDVCSDLENAEQQVARLESVDDQDEIDRIEVMKMAFSTTKSMMGVGPVIGQLYEIRNRGLLEAEMGLGEFTYLFVMGFHDELLNPSGEFQLFGPGPVNSRVRGALRSMLENQSAAMREQGFAEDEISALEAEIKILQDDTSRIPWQDGLPPAIAASFEPFRRELAASFCPAAAPLELMINQKRSFGIESK